MNAEEPTPLVDAIRAAYWTPTHHDLANNLRQQAATDDARKLAVQLGKDRP